MAATPDTDSTGGNETPVVTLSVVSKALEGGTDGVFQFARLGDLSGAITVGGMAASGTDPPAAR